MRCLARGRASRDGRESAASRGPAQTFWQALQSVWLLHMIFHSTMDGNAMGRLDQYAWPFLKADLEAGRMTLAQAAELVDCFCLKFNERAKTTDEQRPDVRKDRAGEPAQPHMALHLVPTRHAIATASTRPTTGSRTSWSGGLTPDGADGTNVLSFLLLESYRRNQMTNPLLTVRVHRGSPQDCY